MVQNPPCWRASLLLFPHWDIKTKRPEPVKLDLLALQHGEFCTMWSFVAKVLSQRYLSCDGVNLSIGSNLKLAPVPCAIPERSVIEWFRYYIIISLWKSIMKMKYGSENVNTINHEIHEQVHTIFIYYIHAQHNSTPWLCFQSNFRNPYCTLYPIYAFVSDQSETRYSNYTTLYYNTML